MTDRSSKWDHPPPLCALTGSEEFLIRKELKEAIARSSLTGRRIEKIHTRDSLLHILDEAVWSSRKVLVIFSGNDFKDKDLWSHWEKQDNTIAIVLVPGKYRPRILKKLPSSLVAKFESPKSWERDSWVDSFLQKEAEANGFEFPSSLRSFLIKRMGTDDLDLLSHQIWKLDLLLSSEGRSLVTALDLRVILTKQSSLTIFQMIKKIGFKSQREVSMFLQLIRENGGSVFAVLALLINNLRKWIVVKSLSEKKMTPEEISSRIQVSSFLLKKEILTVTARWSLQELSDLLKKILEVRRDAQKGSICPWIHLESVLLSSLNSSSIDCF